MGSGHRVLMLAQGFGLDQHTWRFLVPAFEKDYRIILFDYVGSGKSDKSAYDKKRYSRLEGYARDVLEIAEATESQDMIFVGHSVSGMIGMLAALEKPDYFSALIFIGASPCYMNDNSGYVGGFDKAEIDSIISAIGNNFHDWSKLNIPVITQNYNKPEFADELHRSFINHDQRIAKEFASATFFADHRKELLSFGKPVLILQNRNDSMSPLHVGDYLHAHLKNSWLRILDAEGHFPQLTAPGELVKSIGSFIRDRQRKSRFTNLPDNV